MEFLAIPSVTMSVIIYSIICLIFYCSNEQYMDISETWERIKISTKSSPNARATLKANPKELNVTSTERAVSQYLDTRCTPLRSEDICHECHIKVHKIWDVEV